MILNVISHSIVSQSSYLRECISRLTKTLYESLQHRNTIKKDDILILTTHMILEQNDNTSRGMENTIKIINDLNDNIIDDL